MSEEPSYCRLCDQFVPVTGDRDIWGIAEMSPEPEDRGHFDIVCDRCVNEKLEFGKARRGGCLFCDAEPDYRLRTYGVSMSTGGPGFYARQDARPIVCQKHFDMIDQSGEDNIVSIEKALSGSSSPSGPEITIPDSIGQEENEYLEYKETFQYNVHTDSRDKSLKSKISKEVAAFANTTGGVVIIGIRDDDQEATGLERDYDSMDAGWDEFARRVNQTISSDAGDVFTTSCVSIERIEYSGADLCVVRIEPSPSPIFIDSETFYVRQGSSSQPLTPEEAYDYIRDHWET